ncbi:AAA family ATPase [Nocardia fusca]|uniref:AAA family ATPase n=1 Tax=Nocardia fusca TaxID=941183 RepID=A0ABV3FES8_9NOCA
MSATRRERAGGLPTASECFVGRDPELDRIFSLLLGSARLITLIGPGGIGKTRLATEALLRFREAGPTSAYWVRLARLSKGSEAAAIEEEIAQSVVDADLSGRSAWEALVDTLTGTEAAGRNVRTVLVMDNCEHLLAGAGRVITELLEAVPRLTILATSREAVGWVDEHVVVVPPLTRKQALTLFCRRAELTGHPVTDGDQVGLADEVCRHVHDHPLYIRLAAARLLRQPLAVVVSELSGVATDKRMQWSHGPRLGAEVRHQGVRDVIAWSYDLCEDKERLLLDRMSVFAAGYDANPEDDTCPALDVGADLEAIEVVCADDRALRHDADPAHREGPFVGPAREEIEELLWRLADRSLVTVHRTPDTVRYSLLESIRLFAEQRLRERSTGEVDERARLAHRHLHYYRDKVVAAKANWFSPAAQDWVARAAWDNILTAIETSLTSGEPVLGLEISTGLLVLPVFNGSSRELRLCAERTLEATRALRPQPSELQIGAMALLGWFDLLQGKNEDAERLLEKCAATCIPDLSTRRNWRKTPETDTGLPAPLEFVWGMELLSVHGDPRAITVFARAREKFRDLGDPSGESISEFHQGLAACFLGSAQQALEITRRHLDRTIAAGAQRAQSWAELGWALALTKHDDPTEALVVARRTLAHQEDECDWWGGEFAVHVRIWSLAQLITDSIAAGRTGKAELEALATEVAQLAGGTASLKRRPGTSYLGSLGLYTDETNKAVDVARGVLGDEVFAAAYRQGCLLRPDLREVYRLALGTLTIARPMEADKNTTGHWGQLSTAERQVAIFAAAGWTNSEIAARRGNSRKTVDAQMAAIFRKLAITSREDIIELVPRDQIDQVAKEAAGRPRGTGQRPRRRRRPQ